MEAGEIDLWDLIDCSPDISGGSQLWTESSSGIGSDSNSSDGPPGADSLGSGLSAAANLGDPTTLNLQREAGLEVVPDKNSAEVKLKNKKGLKNEKEGDGKQAVQLPPCLVCGGMSSGCHFGIITCESCKVFFRRSLVKNTTYCCNKMEMCTIQPGKRSNCSSCRLKKCIELGMSKDGVKKGRYTLERKSDYKAMVEMLESEEKQKKEEEDRQKEIHKQMITDTVERLKHLHTKHNMLTSEVVERIKLGETRRKEYKKALEEAMGPTPPISTEEACEFLKATGIDITGYRDAVKPCAKKCPDHYSIACVNYLRDLDEFMALGLPDRIAILKGGIHIWLLMSTYEIVNIKDFTVSCFSCGKCLSEEELRMITNPEQFKANFKPVIKLQELNLTEDEKAVLRAFVLFDTSQCGSELQQPEKVDSFQDLILKCVLHVLEENRGQANASKIFASIVSVITESHSIREETKVMLDKVVELFSDVKYSKISAEIYGLPDALVDDLGDELSNLQL